MATYDEAHHVIEVSDDEVRSGVTGHNVRYVLAFGLAGVIAAFAAIAIYFGFDGLHERVSAALAHSPSEVLRAFAPYAAIVLIGAVVGGLLLELWNMLSGPSEDGSQMFMRVRVVAQFTLVCAIMAMLYLAMT
jgi:hypothetical protein